MAKLFFLLSGEFESLSFAELEAILQAEGFAYSVVENLDQTVRLEADVACVEHVRRRSGYTRVCGLELFTCDASHGAVVEAAGEIDFKAVLAEGETFEVRVRRVKECTSKEAHVRYERLLGALILRAAPHARVDLEKPSKTFYGVLTAGKFVFGLKLAEVAPKPFVERRARRKPFFHPSAMNAKLARCMVNLAHARVGDYVLDPFCGTGSTAIEAALIGARAVAVDVQRRMVEGAKRNLKHFGLAAEAVVVADARRLPFVGVDCVVTDPPYGRSATTLRSSTRAIVEGVLASVYPLLRVGQRICIASPKTLGIRQVGEKLGYRHVESHFAYVHRTLTREVAVFVKE